jgi:hypothetical protein
MNAPISLTSVGELMDLAEELQEQLELSELESLRIAGDLRHALNEFALAWDLMAEGERAAVAGRN